LALKTGDDIPRVTALRSHDVRAEFSVDVQAALAADPGLVAGIATRILERHFPESLHQDILNAVGLTLETATTRRKLAGKTKITFADELAITKAMDQNRSSLT
jgi:putative restriction endonuclease